MPAEPRRHGPAPERHSYDGSLLACPRCGHPGYSDILGRRYCGNHGCDFTLQFNPDDEPDYGIAGVDFDANDPSEPGNGMVPCPTCKDGISGKTRKRDCPTCDGIGYVRPPISDEGGDDAR